MTLESVLDPFYWDGEWRGWRNNVGKNCSAGQANYELQDFISKSVTIWNLTVKTLHYQRRISLSILCCLFLSIITYALEFPIILWGSLNEMPVPKLPLELLHLLLLLAAIKVSSLLILALALPFVWTSAWDISVWKKHPSFIFHLPHYIWRPILQKVCL